MHQVRYVVVECSWVTPSPLSSHPFLFNHRFRFAPLRPEQIVSRLQEVMDAESVNATEGGRDAILQLADGDLRRVLNLLQSTSMAYPQVTTDNVYLTAGAAMPSVIEAIFVSLMNDPFELAYRTLLKVSLTDCL